MQEVRQAIVPVSVEFLHEMLLMPPSMTIIGVTFNGREIAITVVDPELDPVVEGDLLPTVVPLFSTYEGGLRQADWDGRIVGDTFPTETEKNGGVPENIPTPL